MICEALAELAATDTRRLICEPAWPSGTAAGMLALIAAAIALAWLAQAWLRRWRALGTPRYTPPTLTAPLLGTAFVLSAIGALWLAVAGPRLEWHDPARGYHLVVVFDRSDSVTRESARLVEVERKLSDAVDGFVGTLGVAAESWRASLIAFGAEPVVLQEAIPLDRLTDAFSELATANIDATASVGPAGLSAALETIDRNGLPGMVVLVSDGQWPGTSSAPILEAFQNRAVPIDVAPIESKRPGAGIVAADLPPLLAPGASQHLRARIAGRDGGSPAKLTKLEAALDGDEPVSLELYTVGSDLVARRAVAPGESGVHFVDLRMTDDEGASQQRQLFTTLVSPPKVLVVGGGSWPNGLPEDRFELERIAHGGAFDATGYDAVVIDGILADDLGESTLDELRAAVEAGVGLLVANGPFNGDDTATTVIGSYEETVLGGLMPVSPDFQKQIDHPSPRDVIILVDTSGSMNGWPLNQAKRMANYILEQLRPVDRFSLITFSGGSKVVAWNKPASDTNKPSLAADIARMSASGSTKPRLGLERIERQAGVSCALFFISDGEFNDDLDEPVCHTTAIELTPSGRRQNRALARMDEWLAQGPGSALPQELAFFQPEPRQITYLEKRFRPKASTSATVPVPDLELSGFAISYLRREARLAAEYPFYPYGPVLAFRESGAGVVGAFTADLDEWRDGKEGVEAAAKWLERLIGWTERERYVLDFERLGNSLEMEVTVAAVEGRPSEVEELLAAITFAGEAPRPVRLSPKPSAPSVHVGRITLPNGTGPHRALLTLEEISTGSTSRPQAIPMRLPGADGRAAAPASNEAQTHSLDEARLMELAASTGGVYAMLDGNGLREPNDRAFVERWRLVPALLAIAAFAMIGALAFGAGRY